MVFNLPVSEDTLLAGMVKHEWFEQEFPMSGKARCSIPARKGEILLTVLIVGDGEHLVLSGQPFDLLGAVASMPVRFPIGGITAAEAEQCILRLGQRKIVCVHLNDQYRDIDVIEKIQI